MCAQIYVIAQGSCTMNTITEFALKLDCRRKIHCCTRKLNQHQQHAGTDAEPTELDIHTLLSGWLSLSAAACRNRCWTSWAISTPFSLAGFLCHQQHAGTDAEPTKLDIHTLLSGGLSLSSAACRNRCWTSWAISTPFSLAGFLCHQQHAGTDAEPAELCPHPSLWQAFSHFYSEPVMTVKWIP